MVIVSNYFEVTSSEGKTFVSLELSGGLELVQSQNTGRYYATMRKCRIPSTFNVEVAKRMIGTTLDGDIVRVEVDPYEYTVPTTGEIVKLAHSYSYKPMGSMVLQGEGRIQELIVT